MPKVAQISVKLPLPKKQGRWSKRTSQILVAVFALPQFSRFLDTAPLNNLNLNSILFLIRNRKRKIRQIITGGRLLIMVKPELGFNTNRQPSVLSTKNLPPDKKVVRKLVCEPLLGCRKLVRFRLIFYWPSRPPVQDLSRAGIHIA